MYEKKMNMWIYIYIYSPLQKTMKINNTLYYIYLFTKAMLSSAIE